MSRLNWKGLVSLFRGNPKRRPLAEQHRRRLTLEQLEDRSVPSTTPLDLTTPGISGSINGAVFQQLTFQPAGCGVIDSFVRVQASGRATVEQGYNTDGKHQFDEKNGNFTRSLLLSDVPVVNIGGVPYREFVLDINQSGSSPLLSLDELRFFVGNSPKLGNYNTATNTLAGLSAVYDMGAGNWVELDGRLGQGTGKGDMALFVPSSVFTGGSYVYLYSKFGVHDAANAGFEQWAVEATSAPVATTATLSGFITDETGQGLSGLVVTLTGTTNTNQSITLTANTGAGGFYAFTLLPPGTYTLTVSAGAAVSITATPGTGAQNDGVGQGGTTVGTISGIGLAAGDSGINFDFAVVFQH